MLHLYPVGPSIRNAVSRPVDKVADEGDFYKHVDSSHFEISRITGVVAQPHKEKVGYSRSLGEVAREEAQEDGESNREILNRNFNYTEGLEFLNRDKTY